MSNKCTFSNNSRYNTEVNDFKEQHGFSTKKSESDNEKPEFDEILEKNIIKTVYDLFTKETGGHIMYKFKETVKGKETTVRNLQFPAFYKNFIETGMEKDKIIFYGSLSLNKTNISDYDLMYFPDNYDNTTFTKTHMNKMLSFMNAVINEMNRICTKDVLDGILGAEMRSKGYEFVDQNADTMTIFKHDSSPSFNDRSISSDEVTTYMSDVRGGCFKISILPNLWLNFSSSMTKQAGDDYGVRFCLFRIKIMLKSKSGQYISIPILDLSYHFCNANNGFSAIHTKLDRCSLFSQPCDKGETEAEIKYFENKDYACFKCTKNIYIKTMDGLKEGFYSQYVRTLDMKIDEAVRGIKLEKITDRASIFTPRIKQLQTEHYSHGVASGMSGGKRKRKRKSSKRKSSKRKSYKRKSSKRKSFKRKSSKRKSK
jgi:hypothetical protein